MVPGASLRVHVSLASKQNPLPVELPAASPRPVPTSVTQEAELSPPRTKDPSDGAEKQYREVLPLPLVIMFTVWAGRPETTEGGKEPNTDT